MNIKNPRTGIEMHCHDSGGSGIPVVLVHGLSGNYTRWGPAAEILRKKYRVIEYDLRGHSLSDKSDALDFGFDSHVEDLAGIMDHFGIVSAVIVGHSMGGMIAQHFAIKYPERTRKAVFCATTSCMIENRIKRLLILFLTNILLVLPGIMAFAVRKKTEGKPGELFPEKENISMRPALLPLVKCFRTILGIDLRGKLKSLGMPSLVLSSSEDELIAPDLVSALAVEIPGSVFLQIENHSHYLPIEQPEAVAAAITDFIEN